MDRIPRIQPRRRRLSIQRMSMSRPERASRRRSCQNRQGWTREQLCPAAGDATRAGGCRQADSASHHHEARSRAAFPRWRPRKSAFFSRDGSRRCLSSRKSRGFFPRRKPPLLVAAEVPRLFPRRNPHSRRRERAAAFSHDGSRLPSFGSEGAALPSFGSEGTTALRREGATALRREGAAALRRERATALRREGAAALRCERATALRCVRGVHGRCSFWVREVFELAGLITGPGSSRAAAPWRSRRPSRRRRRWPRNRGRGRRSGASRSRGTRWASSCRRCRRPR